MFGLWVLCVWFRGVFDPRGRSALAWASAGIGYKGVGVVWGYFVWFMGLGIRQVGVFSAVDPMPLQTCP
eukprot:962466-Amphidinium_carterae.1